MNNVPPEILLQIVSGFPVWSTWSLAGTPMPDFTPQTIARLATVCRQWRTILLPVLWYRYDSSNVQRIPRSVVTKHSHLICELYDPHPRPWSIKLTPEDVAAMMAQSVLSLPFARVPVREGIEGYKAVNYTHPQAPPIRFECTCLTALQMFHDGDQYAERLLLLNPGLKTLDWGGHSQEYWRKKRRTDQARRKLPPWRILTATTIPVQLHSLESLTLQKWKTTVTILKGVLSQCPPTLAKLGLIDLRFSHLERCARGPCIEHMLRNIPELHQVNELDFGFGHPDSSAAIVYLLRSPRAPKKLTLRIRRLRTSSNIIETLYSILASTGKALNTLHILQADESLESTPPKVGYRLQQWETLLDATVLLSIRDFRLEIPPKGLDLSLIETAMGTSLHRLEIAFLGMYFQAGYDSSESNMLKSVTRLLENCPNLQWAKIQMLDWNRGMSKISTGRSTSLVGFHQGHTHLWRCPELRELHLVGFDTTILPRTNDDNYGMWNYGPYFINPLKRQIQALPKLCTATLNYATFWTKTHGYSST